jgi:hypothetical protein
MDSTHTDSLILIEEHLYDEQLPAVFLVACENLSSQWRKIPLVRRSAISVGDNFLVAAGLPAINGGDDVTLLGVRDGVTASEVLGKVCPVSQDCGEGVVVGIMYAWHVGACVHDGSIQC